MVDDRPTAPIRGLAVQVRRIYDMYNRAGIDPEVDADRDAFAKDQHFVRSQRERKEKGGEQRTKVIYAIITSVLILACSTGVPIIIRWLYIGITVKQ